MDVSATEAAEEWTVSAAEAAAYLQYLEEVTYFATAFMSRVSISTASGTTSGCILACSTPEAIRQYHHNAAQIESGCEFSYPYWKLWDVWWYAGLAMLNISGITDAKYVGTKLAMNVDEYLKG